MRTTLTLDDDLAALLKERAREEERSFKEVVNEVLRAGLVQLREPPPERERFRVRPFCDAHPRYPHLASTGELLALLDEAERA